MRLTSFSTALLLFTCVSFACDGTSSHEPSEEPDHGGGASGMGGNGGIGVGSGNGEGLAADGFGNCKEQSSTEVEPDQQTALGFSAREVLAFVEGTHVETLTWHPQEHASYGPESGEHQLTITVARTPAPLRLVHYTLAGFGGAEIGGSCQDALEIDVHVSLTTDQGALDESFDATLRARSSRKVSLFTHPKPDQLGGSFEITSVRLPGFGLVQLDLLLQFTPFGLSGELTGVLGATLDGPGGGASAAASSGPLATWGLARCGFSSDVAIPFDAKAAEFSGNDVLQLLNGVTQVGVSWDGAAPSTATVSFTASSEGACAQLDSAGVGLGDTAPGALSFPGVLSVRSQDGRLDAAWPVQVTARPNAGGALDAVTLTLDSQRIAPTGTLQARYGVSGVDASGYDSAGANLQWELSPAGALSASLQLTGYKNPMCSTTPIMDANGGWGVPGCQGATPTELARATFSAAP